MCITLRLLLIVGEEHLISVRWVKLMALGLRILCSVIDRIPIALPYLKVYGL